MKIWTAIILAIASVSMFANQSAIAEQPKQAIIIEFDDQEQLFIVKRNLKFQPKVLFDMPESEITRVRNALLKFNDWVETSQNSDIEDVKKRMAFVGWSGKPPISGSPALGSAQAKNKITDIVDMTFHAKGAGEYKLHIAKHSGFCDEFPDHKLMQCFRDSLYGGFLDPNAVNELIDRLSNVGELKEKASKSKLLQ